MLIKALKEALKYGKNQKVHPLHAMVHPDKLVSQQYQLGTRSGANTKASGADAKGSGADAKASGADAKGSGANTKVSGADAKGRCRLKGLRPTNLSCPGWCIF